MKKRKLGQQGLEVSALGLGCMGMSFGYGPSDEKESLKVLERALVLGVNFWDTAEVYGPYRNEELLGRVLKSKKREDVVLATKFGFTWNEQQHINGLNSSPEHLKKSVEGSLKRLGTDYIDLYYQHRLDPKVPIEETMGALAELVKAGKVRYLGLSEVSSTTIRKAHAVHPLSAVQSEYSLWHRGVEAKVLPTLKELGIGFVPYSPLGRGFLSAKHKTLDHLDKNDFRLSLPWLQATQREHNFKLVTFLEKLAAAHETSPVQIALAWLLRQGEQVVPIPGTRHLTYLEENVQAVELELPETAWKALETFLAGFQLEGERYSEGGLRMIDSD